MAQTSTKEGVTKLVYKLIWDYLHEAPVSEPTAPGNLLKEGMKGVMADL